MTTKTKCRRCSECRNNSHHWMDNPDCYSEADPSHVCKHCEETGNECEYCCGDGCGDAEQSCVNCNGEGVVSAGEETVIREVANDAARLIVESWRNIEEDAGRAACQAQDDAAGTSTMIARIQETVEDAIKAYRFAMNP